MICWEIVCWQRALFWRASGPQAAPPLPSAAFLRLQDVSKDLADLISRSRGRSNKDLSKLADQLRQIMDKWE